MILRYLEVASDGVPRYFRRSFCSYVIGISIIAKLYLLEI